MSIKPKYADLIFKGIKRFEFRKKIPYGIKNVLVYSSSPKKRIIGFFVVDYILEDIPKKLWNSTKEFAGVSNREFFEYFQGKVHGFAIKIRSYKKFDLEIDPKKIVENFHAPQSYMYFEKDGYENLEKLLSE